jgi:hypothetical protein
MKRLHACCGLIVLFFTVFLTHSWAYSFSEIEGTIGQESETIRDLEVRYYSSSDRNALLELYNERGISNFAVGSYKAALRDFNRILEEAFSFGYKREGIVGAALWGRALCHACLESDAEMIEDIEMLDRYLDELCNGDCQSCFGVIEREPEYSPLSPYQASVTLVAKYVNPNEKLSIAECRERVTGTANALRLFIGPLIKDASKRGLFLSFIQGLEDKGLYCCREGSIWTTCINPLIEKLQRWKMVGIPANPAWD